MYKESTASMLTHTHKSCRLMQNS